MTTARLTFVTGIAALSFSGKVFKSLGNNNLGLLFPLERSSDNYYTMIGSSDLIGNLLCKSVFSKFINSQCVFAC